MRVILVFLFLFLFPLMCYPDSPSITDPCIPDGETIIYVVTSGSETYPLVLHTVQLTDNERKVYETTIETKKEDTFLRIDRKSMEVIYSRITKKDPDFVVETQTKVIKSRIAAKPGEIVVIDFSGIQQILRGLPFEKFQRLIIKFARSDDFAMSVKMKKETTIKTEAGEIPCYEIELGMEGFWGAFLPKTHIWYSVHAPHYLVQYKGQEGPPGSPKITILLSKYECK
ncbi:MAG: hypothetical protein JXB88_02680 [Spirochaetales bacterium]|nr:hypothetical protein [Spirochaetales bacterium]